MVQITNTTQLSTFSIIRSILLSNSVLSKKFSTNDFYEFEPKHKSNSFKSFPYIIINVPSADNLNEYLGDIINHKEFEVEIILRMDYLARDNFSSYASNILYEIEKSNSIFSANGYHLIKISSSSPELLSVQSKEIVEGNFSLLIEGEVIV
jgi:hypothetical protein